MSQKQLSDLTNEELVLEENVQIVQRISPERGAARCRLSAFISR